MVRTIPARRAGASSAQAILALVLLAVSACVRSAEESAAADGADQGTPGGYAREYSRVLVEFDARGAARGKPVGRLEREAEDGPLRLRVRVLGWWPDALDTVVAYAEIHNESAEEQPVHLPGLDCRVRGAGFGR